MDWSEGYVTDVEYTRGYYKELNPALQSAAIALTGRQPPNLQAPFVKVELGCGYGVSLLLEAAAFPHAQFFGIDFNPSHITWAQRIASDAQMRNVTFLDASFADLLNVTMPPADFVALHGVWTWINQDNRDVITRYLSARLKHGGTTMVSYNTYPGWSELSALRELMICKYRSLAGSSETRVRAALDFARTFATIDGPFFRQHPGLIKAIEELQKLPLRYIAHEYFNEDWQLFHHHEVASDLANARSAFIASGKIIENFEKLYMQPETLRLLDQIKGPDRETAKDVDLNKVFRYDIYRRDITDLEPSESINHLRDCWLILLKGDVPSDSDITTSIGAVKLPGEITGPIFERLKNGPASVYELARKSDGSAISAAALSEIVATLIDAEIVQIALPPSGLNARKSSTDRLNGVFIDRFMRGEDLPYLASPASGFAHSISDIERLFIRALQLGADPASFTWQGLQRVGRRLTRGGAVIEKTEDILRELNGKFEGFAQATMPHLNRLGLI